MATKQTIPPSVYFDHETGHFIHEPAREEFIPDPEILFFTVDQNLITGRLPVTISWRVQFADSVTIDDKAVPLTGSIPFHSMEAKTVTLKATNKYGISVSAALDIIIDESPPVIHSFKADKPFLVKDQPVVLSWEVTGATTLEISNGPGLVTGRTSAVVKPDIDSIYTLKATNYFGITSTADLALCVFPLPLIEGLSIPVPDFRFNDVMVASPDFDIDITKFTRIEVKQPSFTSLTDLTKIRVLPADIILTEKAVNTILFPNNIFRYLVLKQKQFIQFIWKKL